jgi:endonuclease I
MVLPQGRWSACASTCVAVIGVSAALAGRTCACPVARALLYMDLRYDGSDGGTPDLELVDRTTSIGDRHLGHLCALLVWHEEDLVDDAERRRNDVIFAWQGNRNPFVDHPEWAQSVWSDGCG